MKRSLVGLLLLAVAFLPLDAGAQRPQLRLIGADNHKEAFLQLSERCASKSEVFKTKYNLARLKQLKIEVGRAFLQPGSLFGAYVTPHKIDITHLEKVPELRKNYDGNLVFPANLPKWSPTLCTVLGHEMAEALYAALNTGTSFAASHEEGIITENRIRKDLGIEGCREWNDWGDYEVKIHHGKHTDVLVTYGGHTHRIHSQDKPVIFLITYDNGESKPCTHKHYTKD